MVIACGFVLAGCSGTTSEPTGSEDGTGQVVEPNFNGKGDSTGGVVSRGEIAFGQSVGAEFSRDFEFHGYRFEAAAGAEVSLRTLEGGTAEGLQTTLFLYAVSDGEHERLTTGAADGKLERAAIDGFELPGDVDHFEVVVGTTGADGRGAYEVGLECDSERCSPVRNERSLKLDGGHYVAIPSPDALQQSEGLTVEAWVKVEDGSDDAAIVSKHLDGPRQQFEMLRTNYYEKAEISVGNSSSSCTASEGGFALGQWFHVALSWSEATRNPQLFVNGESVETSACSKSWMGTSDAPILIGAQQVNDDIEHVLTGAVDEVRVWNRKRNGGEIRATMSTPMQGDEPGLVGYWNFESLEDGLTPDVSEKGMDGQVQSVSGKDGEAGGNGVTQSEDTPF